MIVYSSISPQHKQDAVLRGVGIGGAGALLLVISGIFFPLPILRMWGPWIFFSSLLLLAAGWYPYRQVRRLEQSPHAIETEEHRVVFCYYQREYLYLPYEEIRSIEWGESGSCYGFVLTMNQPISEIWERRLGSPLQAPVQRAQSLFLPFFSYRSFQEWQSAQPDLPWKQPHGGSHTNKTIQNVL